MKKRKQRKINFNPNKRLEKPKKKTLLDKNSEEVISLINERFKDLKHKELDFRSFQTGFLECFAIFLEENINSEN